MDEIAKFIPVTDLDGWYRVLTAIMGPADGRKCYLKVRDDEELRDKLSKCYKGEDCDCGVNLIALVLRKHNLDATRAKEAYEIIRSHDEENITAIREDFDKRFGKKPPQKYFKVLRPLIRVIKGNKTN